MPSRSRAQEPATRLQHQAPRHTPAQTRLVIQYNPQFTNRLNGAQHSDSRRAVSPSRGGNSNIDEQTFRLGDSGMPGSHHTATPVQEMEPEASKRVKLSNGRWESSSDRTATTLHSQNTPTQERPARLSGTAGSHSLGTATPAQETGFGVRGAATASHNDRLSDISNSRTSQPAAQAQETNSYAAERDASARERIEANQRRRTQQSGEQSSQWQRENGESSRPLTSSEIGEDGKPVSTRGKMPELSSGSRYDRLARRRADADDEADDERIDNDGDDEDSGDNGVEDPRGNRGQTFEPRPSAQQNSRSQRARSPIRGYRSRSPRPESAGDNVRRSIEADMGNARTNRQARRPAQTPDSNQPSRAHTHQGRTSHGTRPEPPSFREARSQLDAALETPGRPAQRPNDNQLSRANANQRRPNATTPNRQLEASLDLLARPAQRHNQPSRANANQRHPNATAPDRQLEAAFDNIARPAQRPNNNQPSRANANQRRLNATAPTPRAFRATRGLSPVPE